jgi:hypothetical protein
MRLWIAILRVMEGRALGKWSCPAAFRMARPSRANRRG